MQVVIDVPDGAYEELCNAKFPIQDAYRLVAWIKEGTPLPKGHGRIIDADETKKKIEQFWTDLRGFSLMDALDVIDLETTTYARSDWRNRYAQSGYIL